MAKKKMDLWDVNSRSYFEKFAMELQDFINGGEAPKHGDLDLQYCLELQKKRMSERSLSMRYEFIPRGQFPHNCPGEKSWSDAHYRSDMEWRTCRFEREIYRKKERVFKDKRNSIFYQIITNALGEERVAQDTYTCPACGAISTVETLEKGCPYCGSFFKMSDLFPKITNYYFVEDSGRTGKEMKRDVLKVVIPVALIVALATFLDGLVQGVEGGILMVILNTIFAGILGAVLGYFLCVFLLLGKLIFESGKATPMLFNTAGSGHRFQRFMKKFSPEFSWEYFSDKVVSLLKMIMYAEDATELPYYVGESFGDMFSNVIDSYYTGAMGLRDYKVEGDWCYVTTDVYVDNVYDNEGRVYKKRDKIRLSLCKNIRIPMDIHFSIKRIQCKSCGSSFDATRQRNCPACETRYEISGEDWIVLRVDKL